MWRKLTVACTILLLAAVAACTTVQTVDTPFVATSNPSAVLVVDTRGDMIEIGQPRLQAGELVGVVDGEQYKIPLTAVQEMRAKRVDTKRTTLLVLGLAAGAAGIGVMLDRAGSKPISADTTCYPTTPGVPGPCPGAAVLPRASLRIPLFRF